MNDASLTVGLLGFGLAGRVFHAPLIGAVPELRLKTICSARHNEIRAFNSTIGIAENADAVFADPDIDLVIIATPTATHAALATKALLAGKHVVVDKPVALSVYDAQALIDLSHKQERRLLAFHNRRWDSDFLAVCDAISRNVIGSVTHFESHIDRFRSEVVDRWREDGSPGSGVWFDLGPHIVDQALLLFGKPTAVTADIAGMRAGACADDWAHVILHYPDKRIILHASMMSPDGLFGGHPRFFVSGTAGSLIKRGSDQQEQQLQSGVRPGDDTFGVDDDALQLHRPGLPSESLPVPTGRQQTFYQLVSQCILEGTEEPVALSHLLDVCEIIEFARQSAVQRRTVDILPVQASIRLLPVAVDE